MTLRERIKEIIDGSLDLTQGAQCELIDSIMSIVDSATVPREAEPEKTIFEVIFPMIHQIIDDGDQSRELSGAIQTEIEIITVSREVYECACKSLQIYRSQAQGKLEILQDFYFRVITDKMIEDGITNWKQIDLKERIYDAISTALKPPSKTNGNLDVSVISHRREIMNKLVEIAKLGREIINFQEIVQIEIDRRSIIICPSCGNKFVDVTGGDPPRGVKEN